MTTTVKVSAHVSKGKEAVVEIRNDENVEKLYVLQDTQEWEGHVYDDRVVTVYERLVSQHASLSVPEDAE